MYKNWICKKQEDTEWSQIEIAYLWHRTACCLQLHSAVEFDVLGADSL